MCLMSGIASTYIATRTQKRWVTNLFLHLFFRKDFLRVKINLIYILTDFRLNKDIQRIQFSQEFQRSISYPDSLKTYIFEYLNFH